jgi:hypothetical protein
MAILTAAGNRHKKVAGQNLSRIGGNAGNRRKRPDVTGICPDNCMGNPVKECRKRSVVLTGLRRSPCNSAGIGLIIFALHGLFAAYFLSGSFLSCDFG